jgi:hypothetical protein
MVMNLGGLRDSDVQQLTRLHDRLRDAAERQAKKQQSRGGQYEE